MLPIYSTLVVLFGAVLVNGEIFFKNGAPHIELSKNAGVTGHVRFSRDGRPFVSFEGIPFAAVPERFAASELLIEPDWNGFKNGTAPGEICVQPGMAGPDVMLGQEDCLLLSVHVPLDVRKNDKLKPVMVHIHGGAFIVGTGMGFRGKFFMDEDVVFVSINYRLGVFGFLSTGDEVIPGNNGLKDQVTALKWIKGNIKKFGGNPDLVTVFGESAGSGSTHYLKLSPTTKGLIHRVISQSGLAISPWAYEPNPRENAVLLAKYLNCDAKNAEDITSEEISSCLKKVSPKELSQAAIACKEIWPPSPLAVHFLPVVEPKPSAASTNVPFVTVPPAELMLTEAGDTNRDIPWMTGMVTEEGVGLGGGIVSSVAPLAAELDEKWNELALKALFNVEKFLLPEDRHTVASKLKEFYFKGEPVSYETRKSLFNIYSDIFGNYFLKKGVEMAVAKGEKVYLYRFSYLGNRSLLEIFFKMPNVDQVVTHGDDVMYQDDDPRIMPGMEVTGDLNSEDDEFSRNFVRLFASFARDGKPTHTWGNESDKKWKPVSKKEASGKKPLKYYDINANPTYIEEPYKERMQFLDTLRKYYERGYTKSHKHKKTEL